jgi:enoyl-CoA hydratase
MTDRYAAYQRLKFDRPHPRVLRVIMSNPGHLNAADQIMHGELGRIWRDIDADPDISAAIITGEGDHFSAGGDFDMIRGIIEDFDTRAQNWKEARDLVYNVINCGKPIVSAIRGVAVGAGLVAGLLADISIVAKDAIIIDGHTRLGVAAGDHAAIIWPLLCGMAKAKYFLLTNEPMTGEEAERHNLVALAVDADQLEAKSVEVATKLAKSAPTALRMTKYVLNHWLRQNQAIFDLSAAFEMANVSSGEAREAIRALNSKTDAAFDADSKF